MSILSKIDSEVGEIVEKELNRQREGLELIPSENFVSRAVLEAAGTVLTNKYSEGYPGRRYYGGNQYIDLVENLAIARAKKLFGADHANVQPHSGSSANMAAYLAMLNLGDKILGMDLASGGHLTHGHKINFSGKFYNFVSYGVRPDDCRIDLDEVREIAKREKPKLILAGASAYPRQIDFSGFKKIADEVGAYLMADIAHIAGLVVAKLHPDPVPYAEVVTTTTHKTLRGPRGAIILTKKAWAEKIDKAVMPGIQGGPLEHIIAAKAVAFKEAMEPGFIEYQKQIIKNARSLAETLIGEGLKLVSGGTDNHLMLIDLTPLGLGGKEAERTLDEVGIYTNKNVIPFEKRKPLDPSGIRLGTPAVTTRGFKEGEMRIAGQLIARLLKNLKDEKVKEEIKKEVAGLTQKFPLYPNLSVL